VQGIGGQQVEVAVAESRVELHGHFLARGDFQRAVHEIVVEGLVGQAHVSRAFCSLLQRRERRRRLAPRRVAYGEPGAIGDDALEPDVPRRPRALDRGHEVVDGLVEGVVADDQVLGEGFQPEDSGETAGQPCRHLGMPQAVARLIAVVDEQEAKPAERNIRSARGPPPAAARAASTASTVGTQPRNVASSLRPSGRRWWSAHGSGASRPRRSR